MTGIGRPPGPFCKLSPPLVLVLVLPSEAIDKERGESEPSSSVVSLLEVRFASEKDVGKEERESSVVLVCE